MEIIIITIEIFMYCLVLAGSGWYQYITLLEILLHTMKLLFYRIGYHFRPPPPPHTHTLINLRWWQITVIIIIFLDSPKIFKWGFDLNQEHWYQWASNSCIQTTGGIFCTIQNMCGLVLIQTNSGWCKIFRL